MLDEIDHRIVHALQIAPRAPWGVVGQALEVSTSTASRRWDRLLRSGMAWVIAYPGPVLQEARCSAFLEVACEPGRTDEVVSALLPQAPAATIQVITGEHDLLITAMAHDLDAMTAWTNQHVSVLPGVRAVRTRLVTRIHGESVHWHVGSLDAAQQRLLRPYGATERAGTSVVSEDEARLMDALAGDGRRSAADLAEAVGISAPTVRRRLQRLIDEQLLSIKCEVAHVLNGWPITATFWGWAPGGQVDEVGTALVSHPDVRVCVSITGSANLLFTAWLRDLSGLHRFETSLARRLPSLVVRRREVTLGTPKRLGAVLDPQGRRLDTVPISDSLP